MNMKTRMRMRSLLIAGMCCLSGMMVSLLQAQEPGLVVADPQVAASAQAAVQKMGIEMMKGNFNYGNERMYPRWKRRLAKRHGGMAKLEARLASAAQQQVKIGMMVTAFHASLPTRFFSVWRAKKRDAAGNPVMDATGREVIVEHWLAVVPTVTRVKIADPQRGGKIRTLEESSYTMAVSEKGKNEWYFLTGMKPTIQDLRSLFPSLPPSEKDLGLPVSSAREIK
jgi:hypothetical protein